MEKEKTHITLVIIGHVDSGKSTTAGHLLYMCGNIDKTIMNKFEKDSMEIGKGSFKYAWILDTLKSERELGITINVSMAKFQTEKYSFTLIDAPGHKDFTKNMMTGTSQADVAILVVSASVGEFEAGFRRTSQTKEHPFIAFALGVRQIIVCINKMDERTCLYSQARYDEIKSEVSIYLKKVGFNIDKTPFVPISGWVGDNIIESSLNLPWYLGPTLFEALDWIVPPKRYTEKPLRLPIQNVYRIGTTTVSLGCVKTGSLSEGMAIAITPSKIISYVRSIEMHHERLEVAKTGDYIGFTADNVTVHKIQRGFVVSDPKNSPARECEAFTAHIIIMNHPGNVLVGYTPMIICHTAHIPCRFAQFQKKFDRKTGASLEDWPNSIKNGDSAIVVLVPIKPFCVETFGEYPSLGTFVVRDNSRTVAVGAIKEVLKKEIKTGV